MTVSPSGPASASKSEMGSGVALASYFSRHFSVLDQQGETRRVDEGALLATTGAKIVLGEPGMGKSEFLREAGRRLDVQLISAARFMVSKSPSKFIVPGRPLLIDGLDEAMAKREGDAADMILAQLEEAGAPAFILSCRSREWQARTVNNIRRLYGVDPSIFSIEPLTREEAQEFLLTRYLNADAGHVIDHLQKNRLNDLYHNPLTLGLMGQVAEHDEHLPKTRAGLFERVISLIWKEHDSERQDSRLAQLSEEDSLLSAGAIMAALLFAGAEFASTAGAAQVQEGDVRVSDLEKLPAASAASVIFSSKLFLSLGVGRAKPIHKVIAEFLGARWLARQVVTPRSQRRLLTQLQGSGGVPASLRGLHAWLAFHSPAMAERVIAADPFGVLRYGEAAELTATQADCLFDALRNLAEIDPFFRAQDWDSHTTTGLMTSGLRDKINNTIRTNRSNEHLRSLLIEGLNETSLASDLADTLEMVVLSKERFYREREAAAKALFPHRDRAWRRGTVESLRQQGTEDSTRLARNLVEKVDLEVSDGLLVATLFAEMGVTIRALPRTKDSRAHTLHRYDRLIASLPKSRLVSVLDFVIDYVPFLKQTDWGVRHDVEALAAGLMVRAISENVVGPSEAKTLWLWLQSLRHRDQTSNSDLKRLRVQLDERDALRHAVQEYALHVARPQPTIWASDHVLARCMVGLGGRPKDVTWFLNRLADGDNKDPSLRQEWRDLMCLGIGRDGFESELREISRKFQRDDAQLEAFVHRLQHPKKPAWERKQERDAAKRKKKRQIANEEARRYYTANRAAVRTGELGSILGPAKAYLGLFADITRDQPAADRVSEWLGADLRDDAIAGFEAALHRSDLPTPLDVSNSFAKGQEWNYSYAIMAGLLARQSAGASFAGLTREVCITGLLLCHEKHGFSVDDDHSALQSALEAEFIRSEQDREDFMRLWAEPSLAAGHAHVSALYLLTHEEKWRANGAKLAAAWLKNYPAVPENVELQLVDCLTYSGALPQLASVAAARANGVFRNFDHMLAWLAIDVLVRFDAVSPNLANIGAENPEFIWFLRDRCQIERRSALLPISIRQTKWIVSQFRGGWPYATLEGSGEGDRDLHHASDFLRSLISFIANDTSIEAGIAMQALISEQPDSYTKLIQHMAAEQRQKRAEEEFAPLMPKGLSELLTEGPPSNADDLKSLVLEELAIAQKKLIGSDLDEVRDFWDDSGTPYNENRCRDRLAAMIGPELMRYDVQRITEADMPKTKRADLAFAHGQLQLPMEVKGQWHPQVWDAAADQLDVQYLIDWRSEQRGIYCVLWFGNLPSKTGRGLHAPPNGRKRPETADEMRKMLVERIPEARRSLIDVIVVDLATGKS